jgi:hypothetical protein
MPRQLNIRSDEAFETAHRLAAHLGQTATQVVEDALRAYSAGRMLPSTKVTEVEAEAAVAEMTRMVEALRPFRKSGATSDHSDMYDENGLPI